MIEKRMGLIFRKPVWVQGLSPVWIKVCIAFLVIYALVATNRVSLAAFAELSSAWGWLVLAFALTLPPYLIVSYRFWIVLENQGIDAKFIEAAHWTMIGSFFDIMMPSSSGGDAVKAWYIVRHVGPGLRTKSVMAVTFDRALGLLGLFLLAGLSCLFGWGTIRDMPGGMQLAVFLSVVFFGALLFIRITGSRRLNSNLRFRRFIERLPWGTRLYGVVGCFRSLREQPGVFLGVLALSVVNHIFWCGSLLCITKALNQSVVLSQAFVVFPLAIFTNIFGFAGGFGVGTLAFDVMFSQLLRLSNGAVAGLIFQMTSVISRLIGLPFYLYSTRSPANTRGSE